MILKVNKREILKKYSGVFRTLCILFSVLYLILLFCIDRSFFWDDSFSFIDKVAFISIELLITMMILLFFTMAESVIKWFSKKGNDSNSCCIRISFIGTFLIFVLLLFYFSSWAVFWASGVFIDFSSLRMMENDLLQIVMHMTEANLVYFVLLLCIISGMTVVFRTIVTRISISSNVKFLYLILIILLSIVLYRPLISKADNRRIQDMETGIYFAYSNLVNHARKYKTGPFGRIAFDLFDKLNKNKYSGKLKAGYKVRNNPYIPLKSYVAANPVEKKWNVLIILIESLRPDVLKAFGSNKSIMPALDEFVSKSAVYSNMYTQSSHSDYADMCPLSSHYPLRSIEHHYYPENPTYPRVMIYDILKLNGYRTAVISSQNEHWGNMYNYLRTGNIDHFYHSDNAAGYESNRSDGVFHDWSKKFSMSGKIDDSKTVGEAIRWIKNSEKPFFIYMNLQNSHFPYRVPPDYPKKFKPFEIGFPFAFGRFPKEKKYIVKNRYWNSLNYMDSKLKILFDYLKKNGKLENTVIAITGDTGQAFYEHGFAAHAGPLYNEVMKVPFILYTPGGKYTVSDKLAQHIDISPTILGIMGMKKHSSFQGVDLNSEKISSRPVFMVVQTMVTKQIGIVMNNWKLIKDLNMDISYLYNLEKDPLEKNDLHWKQPEKTRLLEERLDLWYRTQIEYYGDPKRHQFTYPPVIEE